MAENELTSEPLSELLLSRELISKDPFRVAKELCCFASHDRFGPETHELVLRAMENLTSFGSASALINGLVRQLGLFPYLDTNTLSFSEQIAYEVHRTPLPDTDLVFHREQAHIFRLLMEGRNVALSAPTSFGKSLLIDAILATRKFRNIVVVVPTLALIDETRRRLSTRFKDTYRILTRTSQAPGDRNVYVLTQERVLEREDWSDLDFFVIDEFYKLAPRDSTDERSLRLNHAFYRLAKTGAQFYMLGPNISGLADQNRLRLELTFINDAGYHTVATVVHRVPTIGDPLDALVETCQNIEGPTIIFCSSPAKASQVATTLSESGLCGRSSRLEKAAEWLSQNYHPEWHFAQAIAHGVGLHHGRLPRALAQYVVRKFNDGDISFLSCTSTLIEGVNTKARNIIIFDNSIDREPIDLFTFNNIKGRAGRMFQHFVGHVYVFHPDPQSALPFVNVPALSQQDDMPDSLIVQMDDEDLTAVSQGRLEELKKQTLLSFDVIRKNEGIDPADQLKLAARIADSSKTHKELLVWSGIPKWPQLVAICDIIMEVFEGSRLGGRSAKTSKALAAMIMKLIAKPTVKELIQAQLSYSSSPDEAVTKVMDFLRLWAGFHFPRLLRVISRIQEDVLHRQGLRTGNYDWFASQVEYLFYDPVIVAMDEYGVPLPLARRLESFVKTDGDLDAALSRLRLVNHENFDLNDFEMELLKDAAEHV